MLFILAFTFVYSYLQKNKHATKLLQREIRQKSRSFFTSYYTTLSYKGRKAKRKLEKKEKCLGGWRERERERIKKQRTKETKKQINFSRQYLQFKK